MKKRSKKRYNYKLFFIVAATFFLLIAGFFLSQLQLYKAKAATVTYYVSTAGNDGNSGSQSSPFRTFAKAMSVLKPGDSLLIYGGTYSEQLNITKSGLSGSPITIKAMSGQKVILDSANISDSQILVPSNISNIVIADLEVMRSTMQCVLIRGANIVLDNIDSHHCRSFGFRITGTSVTVQNSLCHDNVTENLGGTNTSGGWGACLRSGPGSASLIVKNNQIFNNWGEGLIIGQAAGVEAYGNLVHDNYSVNIYIGNSYDVDVYQNMTYSVDAKYFRSGNPANCITASEENISGWGAQLHNVRVFNNIAYGCKIGLGYTYSEVTGNGCANCLFAYNSMANSGGIKIIAGVKNSVTIINNIVSGPITVPAGSVISNNLTGDPHFATTPGTAPESYRLNSDSPSINAALAVSEITTDFENKNRGVSSDIGAIEYGVSNSIPTIFTNPTSTVIPLPTRTPTTRFSPTEQPWQTIIFTPISGKSNPTPKSLYGLSGPNGCIVDGLPTFKCFEVVFGNIVSASASLILFALFIMFVIGSFRYLTSFGNPDKINKAQGTLKLALIGFGIFLSVFLILKTVDMLFLGNCGRIFKFEIGIESGLSTPCP